MIVNGYDLQTMANGEDFYKRITAKTKSTEMNCEKTFKFDWALYKGKQPTDDEIEKFQLFVEIFLKLG